MFKSLIGRCIGALGLALAAIAPASARAPSPALWEVSDPDTTIYLFGTIHLLPEKYAWQTPRITQAIAGSQQLVVETIVDDKNPTKLMSALTSLAFSPGLPPLRDRVPPAQRAALDAAVAKSGFPAAALDRMETWAAAFMLLGNQFKDMGLKTGEGVETVLRNRFLSDGKSIGELESNVEQLGFFDRLSEKAQRELLLGAIEKPHDMTKQFGGMLGAWARGDVAAVGRSFNRDLANSPELQKALIRQRNLNWSQWIEQRMGQPGTLLIAVGAGHLAGNDSLIEMLRREGLKVRRIQ
jgi:uncharacterized protein YbaP (TraB family)